MYKVESIANYILQKNIGITNLKLQKLVYICFGFYGAYTNKDLFSNTIEAWKHGPVIPDLYHKVKKSSHTYLNADFFCNSSEELNKETKDIIDKVLTIYGQDSAFSLVEKTHNAGTPWDITCRNKHKIIDKNLIINYYKKIILATKEVINNYDLLNRLSMT